MSTPPDQPPPGPLSAARTVALAASLVLLAGRRLARREVGRSRPGRSRRRRRDDGRPPRLRLDPARHRPDRRACSGSAFFLYAQLLRRRDPAQIADSSPGPPPADCDRDRRHLVPSSTTVPRRATILSAFLHVNNPFANLHRTASARASAARRPQRRARDRRLVIAGRHGSCSSWQPCSSSAACARGRRGGELESAAASSRSRPTWASSACARSATPPAVIGAYALMDRLMADRRSAAGARRRRSSTLAA